MIQRIQTLWIVLAIICMALCFVFPTATYTLNDVSADRSFEASLDLVARSNPDMNDQIMNIEPVVTLSQAEMNFSTWPLIALVAVTMVLAVVCIFLFKNRMRQARLVMVAFMLNLAYAFLLFFWAVDGYAKVLKQFVALSDANVSWALAAYLPLASLVFLFLAQRAIRSDEAKVRAADHLR